jgi:hypothetical protein
VVHENVANRIFAVDLDSTNQIVHEIDVNMFCIVKCSEKGLVCRSSPVNHRALACSFEAAFELQIDPEIGQ